MLKAFRPSIFFCNSLNLQVLSLVNLAKFLVNLVKFLFSIGLLSMHCLCVDSVIFFHRLIYFRNI